MYLIGTGGAVIAYLLIGSLICSANALLAEMSAVFPVKGRIIDIPSRFINGGVGFAIGLMAWYGYTPPVLVAGTSCLQVCIHHLNCRRNLDSHISLQFPIQSRLPKIIQTPSGDSIMDSRSSNQSRYLG